MTVVVDSSAIIAILEKESDAALYAGAIRQADSLVISAVNAHESAVVLRRRRGLEGEATLWGLLADNGIHVIAFDEAQVRAASRAFDRYGKGIHAKARLNLCDCAAYALAKSLDAPLLFKGDDFTHTDVERWR
jgi:ribonuclease VapC